MMKDFLIYYINTDGIKKIFKNYIYKKIDIKVSESENVVRNKNILIAGAMGIGLALTKRF